MGLGLESFAHMSVYGCSIFLAAIHYLECHCRIPSTGTTIAVLPTACFARLDISCFIAGRCEGRPPNGLIEDDLDNDIMEREMIQNNVAQLYSEVVQSCHYHRVPTTHVNNQENKDLERNHIGTIKGTTVDTACYL